MADYHLTTQWQFEAPLPTVWRLIKDSDHWPEWWSYVQSVELLKAGDENELGAIRRMRWKTALPYSLAFETEVVAMETHRRIEGRALGQLEGKGIWTFEEAGPVTHVRYDWIVKTNKAWMNWLTPIARPFFEWNHEKVMRAGYEGMQRVLLSARPTSDGSPS